MSQLRGSMSLLGVLLRLHFFLLRFNENVLGFDIVLGSRHLLENVPVGDGAEGALHVRVHDLKAVDVRGVDPAESAFLVSMALYVRNA